MLQKWIFNILHALILCVIVYGESQAKPVQDIEEDIHELILEVRQGRKTLSATLSCIDKDGRYYLPIQELADTLRFEAETDLDNGIVEGFFLNEANSYKINTNSLIYYTKSQENLFHSNQIHVFKGKFGNGDIYATTDFLNKIWPLELSLNPLRQTLNIPDNVKLSVDLSKERQYKRENVFYKSQQKENFSVELPKIKNPYKFFSLPVIDLNLSTRIKNARDDIEQNLNISGRSDLFKSQANYNFGFSQDNFRNIDFDNARFYLEHQNYDGHLPLDLQLAQLGDIRPQTSRLIKGTLKGRGLLLSTEPQKQLNDFDQITVEGEATPGWEVELYRNNELINFQIVDNVGEYRFEDVTLNYNKNIIRTVLYGPEGQIKESIQEYNISNTMLKPGQMTMEASFIDLNRDLILTDNRPVNVITGLAHNFKIDRGINSWLSSFASFTALPTVDKNKYYATAGVNFSAMGTSNFIELYQEMSGGQSLDLRNISSILGANVNFRTALFFDFESDFVGFENNRKTLDTEINVSKSFRNKIGNVGLRFKADHEQFKNGRETTELDFTQNFFKKGLFITHSNTVNFLNNKHQRTSGGLSTTYKMNENWQIRSLLNYDVYPDQVLKNVLSEIRYKDNKKFTSALDVNHNMQNHRTKVGAQVAYDFDKFLAGFNIDWNDESGFSTLLRLKTSLAPYGENGAYIASSKNLSNQVSFNSNVFLDRNYNKIFDEEDEFLEEAVLKIGKNETKASNEIGHINYVGSAKNDYENITLDVATMKDPYMVSGVEGYRVLLRPGTSISVDFPVFEVGLIDGFVMAEKEPISKIKMELLQNGEVIHETLTMFDGYYSFENLTAGNYVVRTSSSHEEITPISKSITLSKDDLLFYDTNFHISMKEVGMVHY